MTLNMRRVFNVVYSGLFFLLSCANSPGAKHSDIKETNGLDTSHAAVKQGNIPLARKAVQSGKATVLIPEGFELMDAGMLASKYPQAGHRPEEVYTNKEGTINIALNYTQNKAEEKDLPDIQKTMEKQFNHPTIEFIQSSMQEINGRKYIRLEFVTPAADSRIYNLLQITSLEGRLAMFTFNCTENYRKDWEATGKEIMQSIEMK